MGEGLVLLRRNRARLAAASLPSLLAAPLAVMAIITGAGGWWVLSGLVAMLGAVILSSVLRENPKPVRIASDLRCDAEGVHLGGELLVARRDIRRGFVIPYFGVPPRLRITRRWPRPQLELEARDLPAAREALARLGLDPSHTTLSFDTPSWLAGRAWIIALMVLSAISFGAFAGSALGPWPLLLMLLGFFVLRFVPSRVDIGLDGVRSQWLWRRALYRYEDVARVDPFQRAKPELASGLTLTLNNGARRELRITQGGLDHSLTTAVYERISEAVEAYRRSYRGYAGAGLERGARSLSEWVASLRRVGHGADASLRSAPVDPQRLLEVVEDASARPIVRVAAAVALGAAADPQTRERVRIAASASVTPAVRVALERASEEDATDAALEEVLAAVEAEEPDASGRKV